jgi:hypothetical protein
MGKYLIMGLERALNEQACDDAVTKVRGLKGVFDVVSPTHHIHRIVLDDNAVPDDVIRETRLVPGVKHVEKPIPHY